MLPVWPLGPGGPRSGTKLDTLDVKSETSFCKRSLSFCSSSTYVFKDSTSPARRSLFFASLLRDIDSERLSCSNPTTPTWLSR